MFYDKSVMDIYGGGRTGIGGIPAGSGAGKTGGFGADAGSNPPKSTY